MSAEAHERLFSPIQAFTKVDSFFSRFNNNNEGTEGGTPGIHPAFASGQDLFLASLKTKGKVLTFSFFFMTAIPDSHKLILSPKESWMKPTIKLSPIARSLPEKTALMPLWFIMGISFRPYWFLQK